MKHFFVFKNIIFITFLIGIYCMDEAYAQVKIGGNPLHFNANALLELEDPTKALLLTRVFDPAIAVRTPQRGMLVYDSSRNQLAYYNNVNWVYITSGGGTEGTNIYNGDGALTSNRLVTMGANNLSFVGTGKVGIGISNPQKTLHVKGTAIIDGLPSRGATALAGDNIVIVAANGEIFKMPISTGGSTGGELNIYNSDGTLTNNRIVSMGGNNLSFAGSGKVGIGFDAGTLPQETLDVNGNIRAHHVTSVRMALGSIGARTNYALEVFQGALVRENISYGFLRDPLGGSIGGSPTGSWTAPVDRVAKFHGTVLALGEFHAHSDKRIKKDFSLSNTAEDLVTLKKIQITNYRYIDSIAKGNKWYKKVIAQQLDSVYNIALEKNDQEIVPSVYAKASSFQLVNKTDKNKSYRIKVDKGHDFVVGDEVQLYYFKDSTHMEKELNKVTKIVDKNIFEVESKGQYASLVGIFVYGKQVTDFLSVDYDALATLNISATQELAKQLEEEKSNNKKLVEKISILEKKQQEMETMKTEIAELKKLLQKGKK